MHRQGEARTRPALSYAANDAADPPPPPSSPDDAYCRSWGEQSCCHAASRAAGGAPQWQSRHALFTFAQKSRAHIQTRAVKKIFLHFLPILRPKYIDNSSSLL